MKHRVFRNRLATFPSLLFVIGLAGYGFVIWVGSFYSLGYGRQWQIFLSWQPDAGVVFSLGLLIITGWFLLCLFCCVLLTEKHAVVLLEQGKSGPRIKLLGKKWDSKTQVVGKSPWAKSIAIDTSVQEGRYEGKFLSQNGPQILEVEFGYFFQLRSDREGIAKIIQAGLNNDLITFGGIRERLREKIVTYFLEKAEELFAIAGDAQPSIRSKHFDDEYLTEIKKEIISRVRGSELSEYISFSLGAIDKVGVERP